jgi:Na+/phosphate symporter
MNTKELILEVGSEVIDLLLEKNEAYGDSALNPSNIFAKGDAVENLSARIDDKLMRIKMRGITDETEDTVQDLIGYLILLKVALRQKK